MPPQRLGPYRIDGLLGEGGMGEVYRGFDETLQRPVAIKTIRAGRLTDPTWRERFLREARSVAALIHPSIVQVFHVQSEEDRDYIVMELVEGRTLAQVFREEGRLEPLDAALLFRDVAEGLAKAHAAGIVHRDIKAANVMVAPDDDAPGRATPGGSRPGRAKILDFGLASTEASMSAAVVGTPQTMSPEQVEGGKVDHRSDLFSLGALLYQAVTGVAPFRADTVHATFARVCTHHPPRVSALDRRIPPELSDLVVRLLQKDREHRPQSAAEVAEELHRILGGSGSGSAVSPAVSSTGEIGTTLFEAGGGTHGRTTKTLLATLLAAVVFAALAWVVLLKLRPDSPPADSPELRPAVAVLGLEGAPGPTDDEGLATALHEMLVTVLEAGETIRVADGEQVTRARREMAPRSLAQLGPEGFARLSRNLGVDRVVWGTFRHLGGQEAGLLRIDLRIQDVENGEMVESEGATGTSQQLFGLVDRAASSLRRHLGTAALTPRQTLAAAASLPADPEALRLYAGGLARLRQLDAVAARNLLLDAVAAEPDHPMPYAALTRAWSALGYFDEARAAADQAAERSASLSAMTRQRIEARSREAVEDWQGAAEAYALLFAAFQDDIDAGLALARAQIRAGETPATLVTLDALRGLPEPLSTDPRIDLVQARAAYLQGDAAGMLDVAERAERRAEELHAPLLVARARLRQTTALQELGEHERALASLEEAKRLFDDHGDRQGSAEALELMAHGTLEGGDLAGAQRLFETVRESYRELGDRRRMAGVQGTLGSILAEQGRPREAVRLLEDTLATFQELGDKHEQAVVLNELGILHYAQGGWAAALGRYRDVLTLSDELRNKQGAAVAYTNIAEILYVQGDLAQARTMHQEALAINREILDPLGIAYDTFRLGKILAAGGDLHAARRKYDEALEAQKRAGEAAAAAETTIELATLDLLGGRAEAAEALARRVEEVLRTEGWNDLAALARTVLARALLAQGRTEEARETLTPSGAAHSQDRRVRLLEAIVAARLRAASPEARGAAVAELDEVARRAAEAGYVEESFEARLAAGEVERLAGRTAEASRRLALLNDEAKQLGFLRIGRDALIPPSS